MIEPCCGGAASIRLLAPACHGDQDHRLAPRLVPDPVGDLIAVQLGQADIEQHHVGPELVCHTHRFEAIVGGADLMALALQQLASADRREPLVVHDQNAPRGRRSRACRLRAGAGLRGRRFTDDR
jgi:hypothetical protein